jgi:hypothetical protein
MHQQRKQSLQETCSLAKNIKSKKAYKNRKEDAQNSGDPIKKKE